MVAQGADAADLDRQAVGWVLAVLRRAAKDIRRKQRRRARREVLSLDAPVRGEGEGDRVDFPDTGLPIEDRVVGHLAAQELLSALTEREGTAGSVAGARVHRARDRETNGHFRPGGARPSGAGAQAPGGTEPSGSRLCRSQREPGQSPPSIAPRS